jgi:hypothetical protein
MDPRWASQKVARGGSFQANFEHLFISEHGKRKDV